jgi:prepilin-type N-terminal cleavage/methylation domain-containing protein
MCRTIKIAKRRKAFTLIEMLVVIGIMLVIAALAAAFAPRITDSANLSRAVDNLEQWLLTAKMRAKRDGLATGIRFVQAQGDPAGYYSQVQYIQQPDPISGGWLSSTQLSTGSSVQAPPPYNPNTNQAIWLNGSMILQTPNPAGLPLAVGTQQFTIPLQSGEVAIYNLDATLGGTPLPSQWLVQPGDYLELRDGGVYQISGVVTFGPQPTLVPSTTSGWPQPAVPVTILQLGANPPSVQTTYYANPATPPLATPATQVYLSTALWWNTTSPNLVFQVYQSTYEQSLVINSPGTTNFRIIRQPRILIGEEPLTLPNNYAVDLTSASGSNVQPGTSGFPEILFAPSGAVLGNNAVNGFTAFLAYDTTMTPYDSNRAGVIAVQTRTGFIGAYNVAPGSNPFAFVQLSRESGL